MTEPVVTAEMIAAARSAYTNPSNGTAEERWTRALLAALRLAPSPWRPIAEAPRDGTPILATLAVFRTKDHVLLYWDTRVIWADDETGEIDRACEDDWQWDDYTHWMPLPQPPGDEP